MLASLLDDLKKLFAINDPQDLRYFINYWQQRYLPMPFQYVLVISAHQHFITSLGTDEDLEWAALYDKKQFWKRDPVYGLALECSGQPIIFSEELNKLTLSIASNVEYLTAVFAQGRGHGIALGVRIRHYEIIISIRGKHWEHDLVSQQVIAASFPFIAAATLRIAAPKNRLHEVTGAKLDILGLLLQNYKHTQIMKLKNMPHSTFYAYLADLRKQFGAQTTEELLKIAGKPKHEL